GFIVPNHDGAIPFPSTETCFEIPCRLRRNFSARQSDEEHAIAIPELDATARCPSFSRSECLAAQCVDRAVFSGEVAALSYQLVERFLAIRAVVAGLTELSS